MTSPLDCPRCNARPEPGRRYTGFGYVGVGLRLMWQDFLWHIRDAWREAHRATYDVCPHPPAMIVQRGDDVCRGLETCDQCGAQRDIDDKIWFCIDPETGEEKRV